MASIVIDAVAVIVYRTFMLIDAFLDKVAFPATEMLRLALETSGLGVWLVDPATGDAEWSAALKQMFGIPLDQEPDFVDWLDFVHPEDVPQAKAAFAAALDPAGDGSCAGEYRVVTQAGETKWIAMRGRSFFTGEGPERAATLFVAMMRDETERKTAAATLQAALDQQQLLVNEVNHRVKNSLQLVSSLVRLQSRRIADPKTRRQLEDATGRISAIAHIHQRLYSDQDIKRIDFGAFARELCADLQGSSPECAVTVAAPRLLINTDRAVPLALIINELVTNAFKYAYPAGQGGPVSVDLRRTDAGEVTLRVADRGAGLTPGFSVETADSLGMTLIGSLVAQLRGGIETHDANPGAVFIVTAPIEV
jgi:PAS domain S-box-containing protein